jgi:hypothetical protein
MLTKRKTPAGGGFGTWRPPRTMGCCPDGARAPFRARKQGLFCMWRENPSEKPLSLSPSAGGGHPWGHRVVSRTRSAAASRSAVSRVMVRLP